MKKSVLAVLTAAMVLAMSSITAFAASPTAGTVGAPAAGQTAVSSIEAVATADAFDAVTEVGEGYTETKVSDGMVQKAAVDVQNVVVNNIAAVGQVLGDKTLQAAASNPSVKVTTTIRSVVEIKATSAQKNAAGKYVIPIKVAALGNGKVIVLHWTDAGVVEPLVPSSVKDQVVTVESDSCSPFAVVEINVASAGSVAKSPKTGETLPAAMMIILLGVAGAVVCGKRYFA